jgi:hypothetical protein
MCGCADIRIEDAEIVDIQIENLIINKNEP